MWLTVKTATGKEFSAQRCYVSDLDGVLNVGLVNISITDAVIVFGREEETETIICFDPELEKEFRYNGYTHLSLATSESRLNGVYLVLRKP